MKSLSRDAIQRMVGGEIGSAGSGGGEGTSLAGYASQAWVNENYLSIEFFSKLFKAYDSAATPNEIVPNDVESTITNIKAMFGLWTEEFLSALGLNSSGGGGGGSDTLAGLLDVELSNPTDNQVLTYYNGKWRNMASQGGTDMTTVWSALGDNSTTQQIAASHLTTALNGYALTSQIPTDNAQLTNGAGYITGIDSSMIITALGYTPVSSSGVTGTFWGQSWTNGGTVNGNLDSGSNGGSIRGFHGIELNSYGSLSGFGGHIDFHFNGSSLDYTSRIYETAQGVLTIVASSSASSDREAALCIGTGFNGSYLRIGDGVIMWDSTNNALKVQKSDGTAIGFYSLGWVSALGAGSSGGGTSSLNEPLSSINTAGLGAPSALGQTMVWNGSAWYYSTDAELKAYKLSVSNTLSAYNMYIGASAEIAGNLQLLAGRAAIGGNVSSSYNLYVYGNGRFNDLVVGNSSSAGTVSCTTVETTNNRGLYLKSASSLPIFASGSYSNQSDIRLKNIVSYVDGNVDMVANAPIFNFTWRGAEVYSVQLGTSAQYWQRFLPMAVTIAPNGYLSLDYSATALAAAVITARKVQDHEFRIAQLEAENSRLKD